MDASDPSTALPATQKRHSTQSNSSDITPRPAKQQKRAKATSVTPKKSPHFKPSKSQDVDLEEEDGADDDSSEAISESEFESANDAVTSEDEDDADDFTEDEKPKPKKRISKAATKSKASRVSQKVTNGELWRVGADISLEPGTEIIIKKPKARPAGKTPYKDDTIHPNTMIFLRDLKANNDRGWLKREL